MGGLVSWLRKVSRANEEEAELVRPEEGAELVRPGPGVNLDQAVPEDQSHHGSEIAPEGANNIEPPGVPHESRKLPDSSYRYLTDPQCVDSLKPLLALGSNADVKSFVENIREQFSKALSLRREVDTNSKNLRELVGRDESAELPACLTIWAEKACVKPDNIHIEYTKLHGESVISSITVQAADIGDDVMRINVCVKETITSCHRCVNGVDSAVQCIMQQHRALSELRCRTVAVMDAMRYAEDLCAELNCFASQVLSLLNNFPAALLFFETKARKQKTGCIAVIPQWSLECAVHESVFNET